MVVDSSTLFVFSLVKQYANARCQCVYLKAMRNHIIKVENLGDRPYIPTGNRKSDHHERNIQSARLKCLGSSPASLLSPCLQYHPLRACIFG